MVTRTRDGSTWRIGTAAEVAWIANGTSTGRTITAAIPPVFEAYAKVVLPYAGEDQDEHDPAVLALLTEQSAGQPWWLGYLDTPCASNCASVPFTDGTGSARTGSAGSGLLPYSS